MLKTWRRGSVEKRLRSVPSRSALASSTRRRKRSSLAAVYVRCTIASRDRPVVEGWKRLGQRQAPPADRTGVLAGHVAVIAKVEIEHPGILLCRAHGDCRVASRGERRQRRLDVGLQAKPAIS